MSNENIQDESAQAFPVLMVIKRDRGDDIYYHVGYAKQDVKNNIIDITFTERFFGPRVDPASISVRPPR